MGWGRWSRAQRRWAGINCTCSRQALSVRRMQPCRPPQCFQCWEDEEHGCINMITEFFTSGALRCEHSTPGRP